MRAPGAGFCARRPGTGGSGSPRRRTPRAFCSCTSAPPGRLRGRGAFRLSEPNRTSWRWRDPHALPLGKQLYIWIFPETLEIEGLDIAHGGMSRHPQSPSSCHSTNGTYYQGWGLQLTRSHLEAACPGGHKRHRLACSDVVSLLNEDVTATASVSHGTDARGHLVSVYLFTLLGLCVSSLHRGHANLLCIVPILNDDPRRESIWYRCTSNSIGRRDVRSGRVWG